MFKQMILLLILISSIGLATELKTDSYMRNNYANGSLDAIVNYLNDDDLAIRDRSKDWIAVYKKGSSNAWGNVISWAWVKDLPSYHLNYFYKGAHLVDVGNYEVRFFKNNSYTVDQRLSFSIKKVKSFLVDIKKISYDTLRLKGFDGKKLISAHKDWVAVYKKSNDNSWKNVIQWAWAKDIKNNIFKLDRSLYAHDVEYQARYFLNNGYTTYKQTKPFYMAKLIGDNEEVVDMAIIEKKNNKLVVTANVYDQYIKNPKDWIGVFKSNAPINRANLIAWDYATKNDMYPGFQVLKILSPELLAPSQQYKVVFFSNDTYTTVGKSRIITSRAY